MKNAKSPNKTGVSFGEFLVKFWNPIVGANCSHLLL